MEEPIIKHLEFIQNIINRMSNNSFLLKGWTVTVSSAVLALAIGIPNPFFAFIALFSSLAFWGLDAYYLRQERLFRCLYDDIRQGTLGKTNKDYDPFSLSTDKYKAQVSNWFRTLWSKSIIGLHGIVITVVVIAMVAILTYP